MIKEIYGKKVGMTQIFDQEGNLLGVTLLEIDPVYVLEKIDYGLKSKAKIGCFKVNDKKKEKLKKSLKGYFKKVGSEPYALIREVAVAKDFDFSFDSSAPTLKSEAKAGKEGVEEGDNKESQPQDSKFQGKGDFTVVTTGEPSISDKEVSDNSSDSPEPSSNPRKIGIEIFNEGEIVDVRAKTKGRGFAGGMKRHGWSGQPKSHGHMTHRRPGSVQSGPRLTRITKGKHMPGHMGNVFRTAKNLKILKIDKGNNILFVGGSIPGCRGAVVRVRKV